MSEKSVILGKRTPSESSTVANSERGPNGPPFTIMIRKNYDKSKVRITSTQTEIDSMINNDLLIANAQHSHRHNPPNGSNDQRQDSTGDRLSVTPVAGCSNTNNALDAVPNIPTDNPYDTLMVNDDVIVDSQDVVTQQLVPKVHCPPIFVQNYTVKDINKLMSSLEGGDKNYTLKMIKGGIRVQVKEKAKFTAVVAALKSKNVKFFTHGTSDEIPIRIVLSGLPLFDVKEVQEELNLENVCPAEVKLLHYSEAEDSALYLLKFPKGAVKLKDLQKIKVLFSVIVSWRYFSRKIGDVIQCFRCQKFGHGMRNCNMEAKCVKCGELHLTKDCNLPPRTPNGDRSKIRCANCSQNHTSNFKGCPTRKSHIKESEEKKKKKQMSRPSFVPVASVPSPGPVGRSFRSTYVSPNKSFADAAKEGPAAAAAVVVGAAVGEGCTSSNSELFSLSEFLSLANDLFTRLSSCQTKAQQFLALSEMMIKYVYNG